MENLRFCPICESTFSKEIKDTYVYCKICGHIYQSDNKEDSFYENHKYRTQVNYLSHSVNRAKYIHDFLGLTFRDKNKKLLDIGCGQGGVLYYLKTIYDIEGYGVNPFNEEFYFYDKEKIISRLVTDLPDDEKYDIIIMSHSLEHIPNLKQVVDKIKKILVDGGILYVEVPHYFYTKQKLGYVFVSEHISYFYKDTILRLFNDKFDVLKYKESTKWSNIKLILKNTKKPKKYLFYIKKPYIYLYIKYFIKYYVSLPFNIVKGPNG